MKQFILLFLIQLLSHSEIATSVSISSRVIGGKAAARDQFPWQAFLMLCQESGKSCSTCGGSLVSRDFILTAAHCTDSRTHFDISLGSVNRFSSLVVQTSTTKIEHPQWNPFTLDNDISLIKLPRSVPMYESIEVIPLAPSSIGDLTEKFVLASGFGKTEYFGYGGSSSLNFIGLKVIDNLSCSKVFASGIGDGQMCATALQPTQTLCSGDSGGPLVMHSGNSYVQVGVVSFTYGECQVGQPTGYVRVSSYVSWINQVMAY